VKNTNEEINEEKVSERSRLDPDYPIIFIYIFELYTNSNIFSSKLQNFSL